jgi:hypothetical protein
MQNYENPLIQVDDMSRTTMPRPRCSLMRVLLIVGFAFGTLLVGGVSYFIWDEKKSREKWENLIQSVEEMDAKQTQVELWTGQVDAGLSSDPGLTRVPITDEIHKQLLIDAVAECLGHSETSWGLHYFARQKITLEGPNTRIGILLESDCRRFCLDENVDQWYSGAILLNVIYSCVFVARFPTSEHAYIELLSSIMQLRLVPKYDPERFAVWQGFFQRLAPTVWEVEQQPDRPLGKFWEFTGLKRSDYAR